MEALKKSMTVETLTKMALCLALICVSAYIAIPIPFTPVLITAQTIIVNLIALLLTPAQSAFVISVYTLMGLCGLPVFSGGAGGIAKLLGPAGRYILGFLLGFGGTAWSLWAWDCQSYISARYFTWFC